ncbi:MAG: YfhO family protein [Chloroflexota bacterium]
MSGEPDNLAERAPLPAWNRWDLACLAALALLTLGMMAQYAGDPLRPLSGDLVNFFVPMFSHLGQELRAGQIPGWNPHQFAGAPFAADPQSGWMSLLVMVPFTLLPLAGAVWTMNLLHLLLLSISTYLFGRLTGLNAGGALAAALVAEFALAWQRSKCCPQILFTLAWLPVMLLAAELAVRSRSPLGRTGWLLLGGVAVSQELSGWLGQGAFYQFLLAGGWLAFRVLLWPPAARSPLKRVADLAVAGLLMFGSGALFNAAALLPRIEYNRVTNVAGGEYRGVEAGWANDFGGLSAGALAPRLAGGFFQGEWLYVGGAALVLAALCPILAPRWRPWLFWAGAGFAMIMLANPDPNPVHAVFGLIPAFSVIHGHYMHRVLLALPLAVGMLAGGAITALTSGRPVRQAGLIVAAAAATAVAIAGLWGAGAETLSRPALAAMLAAAALALVAAAAPGSAAARALVSIAFAALLFWEPAGRLLSNGIKLRGNWFGGGFGQYLSTGGAAGFLLERDPEASRYFGFEPGSLEELSLRHAYIASSQTPELAPLLVAGNQASALGLDDIQGYNPVHPMRYVEYLRAMNGQPQLYRFGNVYPSAIGSPLLDLLGARYAIVPPPGSDLDPAIAALAGAWPTVFGDASSRVLENPEAAPRAWLVAEARAVEPGGALDLLASGAVDGRRVALVEDPALALSTGGEETPSLPVQFERPDSDHMIITLAEPAAAPAMLVIGEVHDAGWKATVDGAPATVVVTDHALMGVPVPAGARQIVLEYDPPSVRIGLAVSGAAFAAAAAVWLANGWRAARRRQGRRT